ncbi:6-phosphofructokinase [Pseudazoarcus pumilus]|uniref:Pyrophosphate--fructose 6-phosphate 1-phosphotransferase n=1 Tax=Pseudazoarcus pumilus TaxID=2067960 RepID=A0A2I6S588_9RHOO|nr:6-phosphofructokinase [Pseudazoarcus pumilus]AUN94413.1 6-phosphofructokinase [Pseudazoarcus pumilus]
MKNLLYAQSGGVTAVINASAAAVIEAARASGQVGHVLAARHGLVGVLDEALLDTSMLSADDLARLARTPGGAFGSCRFDLPEPEDDAAPYDRLFQVLAAHEVGYLLYNGGNGSMHTVAQIAGEAARRGVPLVTVGVPKTVDNDIEGTDCCPGFGSAGKYVATAMLEAGMDLRAMASRVGRVFVMEVMGRNAGWLAAATALARRGGDDPPHIVLMPEVPIDRARLLAEVERTVARIGYCAIAVSEGISWEGGERVMEQHVDAKGYVQLGGAGQTIARLLSAELGYKHHWAIPDYLQRAAGHLVSATDFEQAHAVGSAAVEYALAGRDAMMPAIRRVSDAPYRWDIVPVPAAEVGNRERLVPAHFIRDDGLHVTPAAIDWLRPLVAGELPVHFDGGVPDWRQFELPRLASRLAG